MAMTALAGIFHQNSIIFPEIAALTFGSWAMRSRPWMATNVSLWISPTLAAVTGVLIWHFVPGSKLRRRPFRLYGLIVLSAAAGALPFWLAAGLATCIVYLLYWRMALPCPPAIALAILPTIVPPALLSVYPLHIALGYAAFFMGGSLLFRNVA